jgi:hypothetical protein
VEWLKVKHQKKKKERKLKNRPANKLVSCSLATQTAVLGNWLKYRSVFIVMFCYEISPTGLCVEGLVSS